MKHLITIAKVMWFGVIRYCVRRIPNSSVICCASMPIPSRTRKICLAFKYLSVLVDEAATPTNVDGPRTTKKIADNLIEGRSLMKIEGCVFATCCHGVCNWDDYERRDSLSEEYVCKVKFQAWRDQCKSKSPGGRWFFELDHFDVLMLFIFYFLFLIA